MRFLRAERFAEPDGASTDEQSTEMARKASLNAMTNASRVTSDLITAYETNPAVATRLDCEPTLR